jgi:HNH endonuclease
MAGETFNRPRARLGVPSQGDGTVCGGYGRTVFTMDQYTCAYCGLRMLKEFDVFLQLSVDHVVPWSTKGCDLTLIEDTANLVTCCRACTDFGDRYRTALPVPTSEDEFWDVRDRVFRERRSLILERRDQELERYKRIRRITRLPGDLEIVSQPESGLG